MGSDPVRQVVRIKWLNAATLHFPKRKTTLEARNEKTPVQVGSDRGLSWLCRPRLRAEGSPRAPTRRKPPALSFAAPVRPGLLLKAHWHVMVVWYVMVVEQQEPRHENRLREHPQEVA
jgi:hypothetical protein